MMARWLKQTSAFTLFRLPYICRCLETSSWTTRATLINTTILRPFSTPSCCSSGRFDQEYIALFVLWIFLVSCQQQAFMSNLFQERHGGVLAGDYALVSVRSGMWARSLHCPSHHVSRPWRRLWHRLCLLLLCLLHLLQLLPGQGENKLLACEHVCEPSFYLLLSFSLNRCLICLWPWSWITLSTWLGTHPSWVHITWTSLFAYGGNMIVLHGEILFLFCFFCFCCRSWSTFTFCLRPAGGSKGQKMWLQIFHSIDLSSLTLPDEFQMCLCDMVIFYCRNTISENKSHSTVWIETCLSWLWMFAFPNLPPSSAFFLLSSFMC